VAVAAAREGLSAYTRRDLPRQAWWAALAPQLSPSATAAYAHSDLASIPVGKVRSGGQVIAAPSLDIALTLIPTSTGHWWVLVSRESPTSAWLVERITPPRHEGS
jgi:hypothetical protein